MKKIDMHVHTMTTRMGHWKRATPEELFEIYEKIGVDKAVILPSVQQNEEAMDIVERYPDRFYWFCNIDPRMGNNRPDTDLSYFLEYYKSKGAKGVGEVTCNLYFDDPFVDNLFYHCEKAGMPLLFHIGPQIGNCYGLVDDLGLPRLEKMLAKYPGLTVIGHSQPFWSEIGTNVNESNRNSYVKGKVEPGKTVELFRKYSNLYGDLSPSAGSGYNAMSRDPEFGYAFLEEFSDRIMYGSDICAPDNTLKLSKWLDEAVDNKKISRETYEKVCRKNALRILEGK